MRSWLGMVVAVVALGQLSEARADTWTVLGYIAADNDLEPFAIKNMEEMARVGAGGDLDILVQVDRGLAHSKDPLPGAMSYQGVRRFSVERGMVMQLEDLGSPDMTAAQTLADFVAWGMRTSPADHYVIVFWDHGAGWQGCCTDESNMKHLMSLTDIEAGLRQGLAMGGGGGFDIIGFDQCLMANLDVAVALAGLGDILVASEELEPGEGWDYEVWLRAIADSSTIAPAQVGQRIAAGFMANVARNSRADTYTLSVVDLAQVPAVASAADGLATALRTGTADATLWAQIGKARANASAFGEDNKDGFGLIDLGQFARNAGAMGGSVRSAADAVERALASAVLHKVNGPAHAGAQGLSVYLPVRQADPEYAAERFSDGWNDFVNRYVAGARGDGQAPEVTVTSMEGGQLSATTTGGDIDEVSLLLARKEGAETVFLGELPTEQGGGGEAGEGGPVGYQWDERWPALSDGSTDVLAPFFLLDSYQDGAAKEAVVAVVADVDVGGGQFEPALVVMSLDLDSGRGSFLGAFQDSDDAWGELDLSAAGARVRPARVVLTDNGDHQVIAGSASVPAAGLVMRRTTVPKGEYSLGVHVTDYAGNASTQFATVTSSGESGGGGGCGCTVGAAAGGRAAGLGVLLVLLALTLLSSRLRVRRPQR